MDVIGWAGLVVVWVRTIVPGLITLCTGWVFPLIRQQTVSPRLSGWGAICMGIGATLGVGPVHRHLDSTPFATLGVVVALCILVGGLALEVLSRRPRRPKRS